MIAIQPTGDPDALGPMKAEYRAELVAPLDGMWDTGIIGPAPHFDLLVDDERAGYCVIDEGNGLTQFFVSKPHRARAGELLSHVLENTPLDRGLVFTIDPMFLSLSLDRGARLDVHSYLYEAVEPLESPAPSTGGTLRRLEEPELAATTEFQQACLGGDAPEEWLAGYSANLLDRGELYLLEGADGWIGLGEFRRSETQDGVVDLGMMIAPERRRRGWGADILRRLRTLAFESGLRAICSTTVGNKGAQYAIANAGLEARHRLLTARFQRKPTPEYRGGSDPTAKVDGSSAPPLASEIP